MCLYLADLNERLIIMKVQMHTAKLMVSPKLQQGTGFIIISGQE